ncbi:replication initiation protein, partial [Corynebacterium glutamicum]|uniref:replication initiation protein n=2 Tax=Corynebacterium glutamicum TaxID=1718 RepID=UPI001E64D681
LGSRPKLQQHPQPKLYRVGTKTLSRCQYVALTHAQHAAVLVLDIDVPSYQAGGKIEQVNPQVYAILERWARLEKAPAWIGVNPLTGKCQLIWLIDPVYAAAGKTSSNMRLLAATTEEMTRVFRADQAFSHRLSRWPLHVSDDPTAYRWHAQHNRVDRLADLMEIARTMTGSVPPNKRFDQEFSSGRARIEAARRATAEAKALAILNASLPSALEASGDLIDGVRVLWTAPGRAARDETAFRHALTVGYQLKAAGERLKDAKIIDAYERAYNVAQAVGADGRELEIPPMRDRQTMARRVRAYVAKGKPVVPARSSEAQSSRGRKALATMGRRGGQKAAERWKTDPDGEYAQENRQRLRAANKRREMTGELLELRVKTAILDARSQSVADPSTRELAGELGVSERRIQQVRKALGMEAKRGRPRAEN